jgi:hypothetical protein
MSMKKKKKKVGLELRDWWISLVMQCHGHVYRYCNLEWVSNSRFHWQLIEIAGRLMHFFLPNLSDSGGLKL